MSLKHQHKLVYTIGCPGAGKGTLCKRLANEWSSAHVSVGDELRKYVQIHPEDSDVVECVRSSTLIPVQRLAAILAECVQKLEGQGFTSVIIDGFPRDVTQIAEVEKMIGVPDLVLFFDCPEEIARERVLTRQHAGRTDTAEVFDKRYKEFATNNPEIVQHFEKQGKMIKIDSSGETDQSWGNLLAALKDKDGDEVSKSQEMPERLDAALVE